MYRLRVVPIFIPALRERPGDILLLAHHFIHELNQRSSRRIQRISAAAAALLKKHDWPGNVRELRNVLEYAFVVGEGETLEVSDFPPELLEPEPLPPRVTSPPPLGPLVPTKADQVERIRQALRESGGHCGAAAARLQLSRVTLWRKMKQLGLLKAETARRR
jgi:DNA-binding NtrC family response regulator